jgi:hypothetical protein
MESVIAASRDQLISSTSNDKLLKTTSTDQLVTLRTIQLDLLVTIN